MQASAQPDTKAILNMKGDPVLTGFHQDIPDDAHFVSRHERRSRDTRRLNAYHKKADEVRSLICQARHKANEASSTHSPSRRREIANEAIALAEQAAKLAANLRYARQYVKLVTEAKALPSELWNRFRGNSCDAASYVLPEHIAKRYH